MMARTGRTTSFARSIVWSYWWHRLLAFICTDLLLSAAVIGCFALESTKRAHELGLPTGVLALTHATSPLDRVVYAITRANGERTIFRLAEFISPIWPVLALVVVCQVVSLCILPFSTRRVRRKLQPLNDLALAADQITNATGQRDGGSDKFSNLEQAIHSASVDSPHVSTGDADLLPIEVALNNLLRQMHEAKLQQMQFVSDASHELRTPIQVIQGYVGMLDRWGKTDPEVLDESIEALKNESEHMQVLVEQLLFLARGDSGRNVLQVQRLNLAAALEEVWEESCMIDGEHTYTLSVPEGATQDHAFEIEADEGMVKQVARILSQNASAYAPAGTEITFSVSAHDTNVSFAVTDEGIGMSPEDAEHVFERFYRADEARERREGGTGLGLAIAKWIADAHEASIDVLSREGVGTRFTVRFPRK